MLTNLKNTPNFSFLLDGASFRDVKCEIITEDCGKELIENGFALTIKEKRASKLIFYFAK